MFYSSDIPATIFQRLATWASQLQPTQQQTQPASIIQAQPSTRASRLLMAKSLQQSAKSLRQEIANFRLSEEKKAYYELEAERCENAARQIEMAERRA